MEIIMRTDIEKSVPAVIEFNFEEIKKELQEKLEKYNNLVVSEDGIKDARSDKSSLNKLAKSLNDNRIAQEKAYMTPFKAYKTKVDELISLINKPVVAIDKQIKAFEEKEIAEKLELITAFYSANIGSLKEVLPMEKVLNEKWSNKGTTLQMVSQEMIDKIMTVNTDLRTIEALKLDCEMQMKDTYLKNLNMSEALAEKTRFEEQQKRLQEIKARHAEQAAQSELSQPPMCSSHVDNASVSPAVKCWLATEALVAEETKTVKVIFHDTTQAFRNEMKALTQKHNIIYGGIQ